MTGLSSTLRVVLAGEAIVTSSGLRRTVLEAVLTVATLIKDAATVVVAVEHVATVVEVVTGAVEVETPVTGIPLFQRLL